VGDPGSLASSAGAPSPCLQQSRRVTVLNVLFVIIISVKNGGELVDGELTELLRKLGVLDTLRFPQQCRLQILNDADLQRVESGTEMVASSALSGLYVGQIDARIERAWLRPRTEVGAGVFSCSARIEQDEAGHAQDVTLIRCNGRARWHG
jgi:hypothetical protein